MLSKEENFQSVLIKTNPAEPLSKERLSNRYSPHLLRMLEFIYGTEGMISSGGPESVDAMFAPIALDGKKMLDVGCGFGGVDIYLAKKHRVEILGVDKEPYMIACAEELLKKYRDTLTGTVSFHSLQHPTRLEEFPTAQFDIVSCKQMLYHLPVSDRESYLKEMHRVLIPGGMIVMEDWLKKSVYPTELVEKVLGPNNQFAYLVTPHEYQTALEKGGFRNVVYTDITEKQTEYTNKDVHRILQAKEEISRELGTDTYEKKLDDWRRFLEAIASHEILSGLFVAIKS